MAELSELVESARKAGWATANGVDLARLRVEAVQLGWTEVGQRRGEPTATVLKPTTSAAAHPQSLSATVGLGPHPLHTDGAHLPQPPDVLLLAAEQPNDTPTLLWKVPTTMFGPGQIPSDALRQGMFLVHAARDSFYAPALDGRRWRFDPGCMSPCDQRAARVVEYLIARLVDATAHAWTIPNQVLIIDNRQVLHARAAVAEGDVERRELTRVAFRTGQSS